MEYYNGKLCVTYDDLAGIATMNAIQCIVKKDASIQARKACRSNPALFDLDRLPLKFQLEVYRRRPDLKAQAESKPFVESVEPDGAALDFYQRHQFGDGKYLSTDKQTEYANNAAVLNAFRLVLERSDSQHRKQSKRCISKAEFWRKAAQALPRSYFSFFFDLTFILIHAQAMLAPLDLRPACSCPCFWAFATTLRCDASRLRSGFSL